MPETERQLPPLRSFSPFLHWQPDLHLKTRGRRAVNHGATHGRRPRLHVAQTVAVGPRCPVVAPAVVGHRQHQARGRLPQLHLHQRGPGVLYHVVQGLLEGEVELLLGLGGRRGAGGVEGRGTCFRNFSIDAATGTQANSGCPPRYSFSASRIGAWSSMMASGMEYCIQQRYWLPPARAMT